MLRVPKQQSQSRKVCYAGCEFRPPTSMGQSPQGVSCPPRKEAGHCPGHHRHTLWLEWQGVAPVGNYPNPTTPGGVPSALAPHGTLWHAAMWHHRHLAHTEVPPERHAVRHNHAPVTPCAAATCGATWCYRRWQCHVVSILLISGVPTSVILRVPTTRVRGSVLVIVLLSVLVRVLISVLVAIAVARSTI